MVDSLNLKNIERKSFIFRYQDGLMDIFLGGVFLQFSIAPLLTDIGFSDLMASAVFIPFYILMMIAFFLLKKHITNPRIGTFIPEKRRKLNIIKLNLILFVLLLMGLIVGFFNYSSSFTMNYIYPFTFSGLIFIISFVAAYYLNLNRLFYYGILVALAPLIGEWLWNRGLVSHHGFPVTFGVVSAIIILIGLIMFVHFCRTNPVIDEESFNE